MKRALAPLLVLLACGGQKEDAPPKAPCRRAAPLSLREVDHDSAYAKQLFAHVGMNRDGSPTDPAAAEAGVRVEIDQWRPERHTEEDELPAERGELQTDYYPFAYDRAALARYLAAWEKPPADRQLLLGQVTPFPGARDPRPYWRAYYVVAQPILTERHFASGPVAAVTRDAITANPDSVMERPPHVILALTPEGTARLATETTRLAKDGKKLAAVVDDAVVSAPIVASPIKSGRISITASSVDEVNALAAKLQCVK